MKLDYTNRYNNDECICGRPVGIKQLIIDNLTETRTLLRCYRCRGIVGWWDHETPEQQEARIRKYYEEHPNAKWSQEEIDNLFKVMPPKRGWSMEEQKQLA